MIVTDHLNWLPVSSMLKNPISNMPLWFAQRCVLSGSKIYVVRRINITYLLCRFLPKADSGVGGRIFDHILAVICGRPLAFLLADRTVINSLTIHVQHPFLSRCDVKMFD